jgi:hypothetical protein
MAHRKSKGHKSKAKISLLSMAPIAVPVAYAYLGYQSGGGAKALDNTLGCLTGMHFYGIGGGEGTGWKAERMVPFVATLASVYVAKKMVGISGVNRGMKALPFRL